MHARAWLTTRLTPPVPAFKAISTIAIERLLDLFALVAMIGLMLVMLDVPSEVTSAGILIGIAAVVGSLGLLTIAIKPHWAFAIYHRVAARFLILERFDLENRLQHFVDGLQPMGTPAVAIKALLWTVISWAFSLAAGYVLLFMFFEESTFGATLSLIVLLTMSVALPAVPGNLGPFEGAAVGGLWIGQYDSIGIIT